MVNKIVGKLMHKIIKNEIEMKKKNEKVQRKFYNPLKLSKI